LKQVGVMIWYKGSIRLTYFCTLRIVKTRIMMCPLQIPTEQECELGTIVKGFPKLLMQ
jgi:hypothetical protein